MSLQSLSKADALAILAKGAQPKRMSVSQDIVTDCPLCDKPFDMGYCMTELCENNPYKGVQGHECPNCGWCETPGTCPWSVACPVCGAGVGLHCRQNHRVVGLHAERHESCISL